MNYAKYRVNVLRSQLDSEFPDFKLVEKAQIFLRVANTLRDRILAANMRLVVSIVKKHVTPQYSFDELLSDGIDTLMKAVDKFDFDQWFPFQHVCLPLNNTPCTSSNRLSPRSGQTFHTYSGRSGDMSA